MSQSILLIQGDPVDAKIAREALLGSTNDAFTIEWVKLCSEGVERLTNECKRNTHNIAAVLTDLFLSDSDGIATFDRLFQASPHIPILIISAAEDEEVAKLAVQRGAQDYLLKERLDNYSLPKTIGSMIERAANVAALFDEKERAQVTLNSIGDAVISTDERGQVTYLNVVGERLTGWSCAEAVGHPLEDVFHLIDAITREIAPNPMARAIRENRTVNLTPNCVLIRRDGIEAAIEDSAAPIHDRRGQVTGAVMVFHDVSVARAMSLRMSYLAQHDSLTDLPNRSLFSDRLNQAMAMAARQWKKLAVLFLDLDRFKHVNDTLGHAIGDRLLQSVAQRLCAGVRASDSVSRQGGDEFVILLSQLNQSQDAEIIAKKLLIALRAPHRIDQHDLHLTVSIGIAVYPDDGIDADTLMKNADFAMYHAKEGGRDNCQIFEAEMNALAVQRQSIESGLRLALKQQQFVLHYQPKLNLHSGKIVGVEALVRWQHPQHGLMLPAQFIPIAEESGLIVPIGRWVMHEACRQARAWQDAGLPSVSIAVNTSAVELRANDFVTAVRAILLETGLRPECLELELTETFLMQDERVTASTLRALKQMGVQLALDDFGTGYSSLSYVKRFPITSLKIDRSFVCNLGNTDDTDDASIVSAVINMGKSLHMKVVAEGVETSAQLAYLQAQGCPEGQGYYFSQPVAHNEIAQLLSSRVAETALLL